MNKKKVIAVASIGGHWIQLQRIARPPAQMIKENKYAYVATNEKELRELLHMDLRPLKKIGEFASESLVKSLKDFIDFNV